jgi:hypothetical protein
VVGVPDFDDITYTNCGRARFYVGSGTPTYNTAVTGLFNNAQTGTSVAIIFSSYRKLGVAVGTPSGVTLTDAGGTVQILEWQ